MDARKTSATSLDDVLALKDYGYRLEAFRHIGNCLLSQHRPLLIVETGSMRPGGSSDGDGHSSMLWDWIVRQTGGAFYTIDIDPANTTYTQPLLSKNSHAFTMESLKFFSTSKFLHPIDLLYLDSMDWMGELYDKMLSSLHHVGELAAAWKYVAAGGIIAVDDCYGPLEGKHALVECFFNMLEVSPFMTGPIYAWQKSLGVLSK